jgi:hypothetical protein
MSSQTEVVNVALTRLGEARVISIDDDSVLAADARAMWDTIVRGELRAHLWRFALARASLPALADAPAWGFAYQYVQPADCLRVVQVGDVWVVSNSDVLTDAEGPWAIEGRLVLTDYGAPLQIRYLRNVEDVSSWDALFCSVLAYRLAMELAEIRTQSNTKDERLERRYKDELRRALRAGALETPPTRVPDGSYPLARRVVG